MRLSKKGSKAMDLSPYLSLFRSSIIISGGVILPLYSPRIYPRESNRLIWLKLDLYLGSYFNNPVGREVKVGGSLLLITGPATFEWTRS